MCLSPPSYYKRKLFLATRDWKSKMVPAWEAGCQLLWLLCVFLLLVTLVTHTVNTLLVYDRQMLLNLRTSAKKLVNCDSYGQKTLPHFLSDFLSYLCSTQRHLLGENATATGVNVVAVWWVWRPGCFFLIEEDIEQGIAFVSLDIFLTVSLSGWYRWRAWMGCSSTADPAVVSGLSSSKVSACSMLIKEFCGGKAGWNDRAVFIETDFR